MGNWMRKKIIMKTIQNVEFKKDIVWQSTIENYWVKKTQLSKILDWIVYCYNILNIFFGQRSLFFGIFWQMKYLVQRKNPSQSNFEWGRDQYRQICRIFTYEGFSFERGDVSFECVSTNPGWFCTSYRRCYSTHFWTLDLCGWPRTDGESEA